MPSREPVGEGLEEFLRLWRRLRDAVQEPGTVVVVEGVRDRRSLSRLGLGGPIVLVHRGASLSHVTHALSSRYSRTILLTDWDRTGGQLSRRLAEFLEADGIDVDVDFRRRLGRTLRGELVHVEGLDTWARHLAERAGTTWSECVDRER